MKALPDLKIDVQRRDVAEDAIVVEAIIRGTHLGGWRGLPATGRPVEFPLCGIYTFDADDRLAGERIYDDGGTVLRQLGVFHEPRSVLGQFSILATHRPRSSVLSRESFCATRRDEACVRVAPTTSFCEPSTLPDPASLRLFHSASALWQYDNTHAAAIACVRVVSTVTVTAAIKVSNVATNKALMAIGLRLGESPVSFNSDTLAGQTICFEGNLGGCCVLAKPCPGAVVGRKRTHYPGGGLDIGKTGQSG
jgi:hypothetical protein